MSVRRGCGCDPEEIFELADGALTPEREREIRAHLRECPGCHELYERERMLNDCLGSLNLSEPRSVCQGVAMSLPTRPVKVRFLWALLAGGLLLMSLGALGLNGVNPAALMVETLAGFWAAAMILADLLTTLLSVAGPVLLVALAVGGLLDILLAVVLFSAVRRRTRAV